MKSRSKLDLSQVGNSSSEDLTVKSKWKKSRSDLTFSDSWSHTSPNSSLNSSLAPSAANSTWSGSSLSFFTKKKKRGRLSVGEFQQNETLVEADELPPKNGPLTKWQKRVSVFNLPQSTAEGHVQTTPKVSISSAKSMSDIADLPAIGGRPDGSAERG